MVSCAAAAVPPLWPHEGSRTAALQQLDAGAAAAAQVLRFNSSVLDALAAANLTAGNAVAIASVTAQPTTRRPAETYRNTCASYRIVFEPPVLTFAQWLHLTKYVKARLRQQSQTLACIA